MYSYLLKNGHVSIFVHFSWLNLLHVQISLKTWTLQMAKYDRNTPYNDLPLLPPSSEFDNDPQISLLWAWLDIVGKIVQFNILLMDGIYFKISNLS